MEFSDYDFLEPIYFIYTFLFVFFVSCNEDGGIELQEFGNGITVDPMSRTSIENNNNNNNNNNLNNNHSNDLSQANSAISIDYPDQLSSTIGEALFWNLKIKGHKKNLKNFIISRP